MPGWLPRPRRRRCCVDAEPAIERASTMPAVRPPSTGGSRTSTAYRDFSSQPIDAAILNTDLWSWRESNPRPSGGHPTRYDHSRISDSRQSARRVEWARGPAAGSFSDVSGLCRLSVVFPYCPPTLLVPGCDGQAPRGIAARDDSLLTDLNQAARVRSSVLASLCLPCLRSLSNSGRTLKHPGPNVETDQPRCAVACQCTAPAVPKNCQESSL